MIEHYYSETAGSALGGSVGGVVKAFGRKGRNHSILLDTTWGRFLDARKMAGMYHIRSSELTRKLMPLQRTTSS